MKNKRSQLLRLGQFAKANEGGRSISCDDLCADFRSNQPDHARTDKPHLNQVDINQSQQRSINDG